MIDETQVEKKPVILFPINANPPHMGHLIVINMLLTLSSRLYVVLYDKMQVVSVEQSKLIFDAIFSHYITQDKIKVITSSADFAHLSSLPENMTNGKVAVTIATTSKHIYANLKAKEYPYVMLVKRPMGWCDEFYRISYIRSIILNQIEKASWTKQTQRMINKL